MLDKKLPTTLHLHLSLSEYGDNYTIFTGDKHVGMVNYPYLASVEVVWPVTEEQVAERYDQLKLSKLYADAGELQHQLDLKNEEIKKFLAIGHEKPLEPDEFIADPYPVDPPAPVPYNSIIDDDIPF